MILLAASNNGDSRTRFQHGSSSSTERVNTGPCGVIESEVHPRASIRRGGGRRKATQKRKKKKKKISKRTWWISKWDQVYILEQGRSYPSRSLRRNVGRYIILEEGGNTCLIQFQEQAPRRPFNFSSANRASPRPPSSYFHSRTGPILRVSRRVGSRVITRVRREYDDKSFSIPSSFLSFPPSINASWEIPPIRFQNIRNCRSYLTRHERSRPFRSNFALTRPCPEQRFGGGGGDPSFALLLSDRSSNYQGR